MRDPSASRAALIGRGLAGRCPRCGAGGIFKSFFDLHERCPNCGVKYERESGYWVGSMIIVTTITFGLFVALLVGGMILTWPDVPWNWLLGVTIGANLVVPILAYPRSKTLWSALEMSWHPLEPTEIAAAASHVDNREAAV